MKLTYIPKEIVCSCCGAAKPETEYYRESYTEQPTKQCKECINIKRAVTRARKKHGKFISKEKQRHMTDQIDYTIDDWRDAMLHFRGACAFCGRVEGRAKASKHDRDHLIAISRGGKTVRENIVPACRRCNRGRGNRAWSEWFRDQDFYDSGREEAILVWQCQATTNDDDKEVSR